MGRKLSKRLTVGVLINDYAGQYQTDIMSGIEEYAANNDVDLQIFVGKSLKSTIQYEIQQNVAYKLIDMKKVDGIIITSGSIGNFVGKKELLNFVKPFRSVPLVSISVAIKGIPSILTDNLHGMYKILKHLIEVHRYKRLAFIRGPKENPEAETRYKAYLKALEDYSIPFDPDLVAMGDFSPESGPRALKVLLDERKIKFDALVSSNDDMAITIHRDLQARGLRVPDQLAVTGFDDVMEMANLCPPFTTVRQPLYEQGQKSVEILLKLLLGETVPAKTMLPAIPVIRESCGCPSVNIRDFLINKDAVNNGKPTGIVITPSVKKQIVDEILVTLDGTAEYRERSRKNLQGIMTALEMDIREGARPSAFESQLSDILYEDCFRGNYLIYWHKAISILRCSILKLSSGIETYNYLENLFQRVQVFFTSMIIRRESKQINENEAMNNHFRQMNRNLNSTFAIPNIMDIVKTEVMHAGIRSAFVVLYPDEMENMYRPDWKIPRYGQLTLGFSDGKNLISKDSANVFPLEHLLPEEIFPLKRRGSFIIQPLFKREIHFGYMLLEIADTIRFFYEILGEQISDSLHSSMLFRSQRQAEKKLKNALREMENLNHELHNISVKDELTGLYNRRGFYALADQHLNLCNRTHKSFILIFLDLDGLKKINDTYGHKEGDEAIKASAKIIKKVFRSADIMARLGGDEFVVIAVDNTIEDVDTISNRLTNGIDNFNRKKVKPYHFSISMGFAKFDPDQKMSLSEIISNADKELYRQKKIKKMQKRDD
ncbi:MAG: GGDEF domain-containing protein [Spirochaetales bacterium]|nr:GGDEF domain-containing protein [Spirochaetales bacterium]